MILDNHLVQTSGGCLLPCDLSTIYHLSRYQFLFRNHYCATVYVLFITVYQSKIINSMVAIFIFSIASQKGNGNAKNVKKRVILLDFELCKKNKCTNW